MNTSGRRNVLLITLDQWRGDCLSALDHPCIKTPNFDRLANDGILFRNHFTVCTPCGPSRASLLTGMYLQNHRVVQNGAPLDNRHSNLARELRVGGYRPTLFGYTDTSLDPRAYDEATVIAHGYENMLPGFEEGLLLTDGNPQPWLKFLRKNGYPVSSREDAYGGLCNGDELWSCSQSPSHIRNEHSQTAFLTNQLIDYVSSSEPGWCVHLSYLRPHPPIIASEPWHSMYSPEDIQAPVRAGQSSSDADAHPFMRFSLEKDRKSFEHSTGNTFGDEYYDRRLKQLKAVYFGLVSEVDYHLGRLIDHLRETGEYDNTLIVLTSDHGDTLGDHWLMGKRCWFDSAAHVPLIVVDPDQTAATRNSIATAFTESVDVMPTILDALELDIPRQCDGYSLLPHLRGESPTNSRTEVHWEYDFRDILDAQICRQLGISAHECQFNVIRSQRYKYIHFTGMPNVFYDLNKDPDEYYNVIDKPEYAQEALAMPQTLLSWRMRND